MRPTVGKVSGIKIVGTRAQYFFLEVRTRKSVKNGTFLQIALYPKNFNGKTFRGKFSKLNFEDFGRYIFFNTANTLFFFLENRVNYGRP